MGEDKDALLYPREVAALFSVSTKTVQRWTTSGKIPYVRTLGGHRRYRASQMREVLAKMEAGYF